MKSLDEVLQAVEAQKTVDDSIISLLSGDTSLIASLKAQIADILSKDNITADTQAKIDAAFDAVSAETQKISDAVTANTPSEG